MVRSKELKPPRFVAFEHKRDANGFAVRPQHWQQYKEYAGTYKAEEEKRSDRWKNFLLKLADLSEQDAEVSLSVDKGQAAAMFLEENFKAGSSEFVFEKAAQGPDAVASWKPIRASVGNIEQMMGLRVENEHLSAARMHPKEPIHPLKKELECLVHSGLPMALRGEIWQAFVGARVHRVEGYYDSLLAVKGELEDNDRCLDSSTSEVDKKTELSSAFSCEKWKQMEKDLPKTFPGHPSLDEDGRNALRRLLEAYARHDPKFGYCQAMNFFAGLLLLLMPEENAFWTLVGIIDCFNGYFSEEMIESQVDQVVLKELVQEKIPNLANHLDCLGLQLSWITEPWFLSIFTNVLPWQIVLRVWDVLLFDGNRVMLFQTVLALLELYGPSLMDTKHACDAVMLLRSLASSTLDSNQLVSTACEGYQSVSETVLQELRNKHKPSVIASVKEREEKMSNVANEDANRESDSEVYSLKDQAIFFKFELCQLQEEIRSSFLRADELKIATMEVVKHDNRLQLSAKVQHLDKELFELRVALSGKLKEEQELFQELMFVERKLKIAEKPGIPIDQDSIAQRYGAIVLQEHEIFEEKDKESSQQKSLISHLPSPSSNLYCRDTSIVVKITEQLIVLCDSGTDNLSSAELRGVMFVHIPANIDRFIGIQINDQLSGMTIKHHSSASQEAFAEHSILKSESQLPFPDVEFRALRWCKINNGSLPLEVEANRHRYKRGCYVKINYKASGRIKLNDVLISMPIPLTKKSIDIDISKDKGRCIIEEREIVWRVPPIDVSNTSGSIIIKYTFMGWPEVYQYFPINVRYSFADTYGLKVGRAFRCNDGNSLNYAYEYIGTAGYTLRGSKPDHRMKIRSEQVMLPWNIEEIWSEDDFDWEDG
uniref:Uncharacterized protein n=1 Tax=Avena sativa TaxID=4498 RepID=A0ACD5ZTG5_AVESA